jgi:hypothetical protein
MLWMFEYLVDLSSSYNELFVIVVFLKRECFFLFYGYYLCFLCDIFSGCIVWLCVGYVGVRCCAKHVLLNVILALQYTSSRVKFR